MNIIMHIDANSAYLSWTAVDLLEKGYLEDIRESVAVISGNPENRHGIILAKSIKAKKYDIKTGESLFEARSKYPELKVFSPDYNLYLNCSDAMHGILSEYSPLIQRYSVDECFLDYTSSRCKFGDPLEVAHEIKDRIKDELGFTVNIGISCNKLLAKMGSELKKPNRVHTLFPEEMEAKLWPLPVSELFMVGRATSLKLNRVNIRTIGQLAAANPLYLKAVLKSHGLLIWNYANGRDDTPVVVNEEIIQKGVGNSTTMAYDVTSREEACQIILALVERTSMRLRSMGKLAGVLSVSIKTDQFTRYSHQLKLPAATDSTMEIYGYITRLFDECWRGEPLRHMGVAFSDLSEGRMKQFSMFEAMDSEKTAQLDKTLDRIRNKYGEKSILRGTFVNGQVEPLQGGTNEGNYIMMGGYK